MNRFPGLTRCHVKYVPREIIHTFVFYACLMCYLHINPSRQHSAHVLGDHRKIIPELRVLISGLDAPPNSQGLYFILICGVAMGKPGRHIMSQDIFHSLGYKKSHSTTKSDLFHKTDSCQISPETYFTPQTIKYVTPIKKRTYFMKQTSVK